MRAICQRAMRVDCFRSNSITLPMWQRIRDAFRNTKFLCVCCVEVLINYYWWNHIKFNNAIFGLYLSGTGQLIRFINTIIGREEQPNVLSAISCWVAFESCARNGREGNCCIHCAWRFANNADNEFTVALWCVVAPVASNYNADTIVSDNNAFKRFTK